MHPHPHPAPGPLRLKSAGSPLPLAFRLLRHRRSAWISFVGIYALGLSVYLVVNGLARNFQAEIRSKSKELLEGDLRVHARRPFTSAEEASLARIIPPGTRQAEVWGFLSMLRAGPAPSATPAAAGQGNLPVTGEDGSRGSAAPAFASRLVQVKAISRSYPLIGSFAFAGATGNGSGGEAGGWSGRIADLRSGDMLVPPDLLPRMRLKAGDTVALGNASFRIRDVFTSRPGGNFEFWEMGSRVYILLDDMPATGLEAKGSRIFRYRFYGLPPAADAAALRDSLEAALADPEVDVSAYTDEGSDLGRTFHMVVAFLKMLSLSAFLLSAVGAAFFFRHHLVGERKTVAVLATLGASRRKIVGIYVAQNLALSSLAAALGMGLARLWSIGLPLLIQRLYAVEIPSALPAYTYGLGWVLAVCTSLLFCLTGFAGLGRVPPATLVKPLEGAPLRLWPRILLFAAQGAFFFALAMADSRSWVLSALAVGSMGAAFLLLAALGWAAFRVLWALRSRLGYPLRIALGSIRWGREKSLLAFAALGFVAFTSCLIPQLQDLILNEIRVPQGRVLPQLFLFDIQDEQLDGVQSLLKSKGHALDRSSPMVRARLTSVNGKPFKREEGDSASARGWKRFLPWARAEASGSRVRAATVESRNRQQIRNRGFNLSFRDSLSDAERVTAGSWWHGPAAEGALPEVSVEKEFAKRVGLGMGDTLRFDVQGVEVDGRVTSLRQVRWASFQPNFFVLFQPGALEAAPKTWLGTLGGLPAETAGELQDEVSAAYPNVTIMNLQDVIGRTIETLGKLSWLVRFLSGFALLIGLAILWLIVDALVGESRKTVLLLRAMGEPRARLALQSLAQYGGFCLAAGATGWALSLAAAWLIDALVWQVPWIPDWRIPAICCAASAAVGALCSVYAAFRGGRARLRGLLALSRS
jgi:putative ABC transport system permease protein